VHQADVAKEFVQTAHRRSLLLHVNPKDQEADTLGEKQDVYPVDRRGGLKSVLTPLKPKPKVSPGFQVVRSQGQS
jgi:hypothetical protein